ncbi:MAG: hypothetical protein EP343_22110 [Deltaproteobacteria bacterium]|nr:MAG: hypothetical protein EP343_22110 [Deltaproteobacteria bacterium]
MELKQQETSKIVEEVLQDDYIKFQLVSYSIEEDVEERSSRVLARVQRSDQDQPFVVEGSGVGALDAFFAAVRMRLGEEYPSVRAIIFSSLAAKDVPGSDQDHPTDAEAEVNIRIQNSYGDSFEFVNRSRSLLRASLHGLLETVEYFVNSERTYVRLLQALEHYRQEGRSDLIDKYTSLLSIVVRNTSYEEVSERLKKGDN